LNLNPEISTSLKIIHTINEHLAEAQCNHNITQIMKEAINFEGHEKGLDVTSIQNQQNTTVQSAGEPIDIASNKQRAN
jgi:hypothetical protein